MDSSQLERCWAQTILSSYFCPLATWRTIDSWGSRLGFLQQEKEINGNCLNLTLNLSFDNYFLYILSRKRLRKTMRPFNCIRSGLETICFPKLAFRRAKNWSHLTMLSKVFGGQSTSTPRVILSLPHPVAVMVEKLARTTEDNSSSAKCLHSKQFFRPFQLLILFNKVFFFCLADIHFCFRLDL